MEVFSHLENAEKTKREYNLNCAFEKSIKNDGLKNAYHNLSNHTTEYINNILRYNLFHQQYFSYIYFLIVT